MMDPMSMYDVSISSNSPTVHNPQIHLLNPHISQMYVFSIIWAVLIDEQMSNR